MHVGHGIGKLLNEERFYLVKDGGVYGCGRRVIQIDYSFHFIPPELPQCSFPPVRRGVKGGRNLRGTYSSGLQNPLRLAFDRQYNRCDARNRHECRLDLLPDAQDTHGTADPLLEPLTEIGPCNAHLGDRNGHECGPFGIRDASPCPRSAVVGPLRSSLRTASARGISAETRLGTATTSTSGDDVLTRNTFASTWGGETTRQPAAATATIIRTHPATSSFFTSSLPYERHDVQLNHCERPIVRGLFLSVKSSLRANFPRVKSTHSLPAAPAQSPRSGAPRARSCRLQRTTDPAGRVWSPDCAWTAPPTCPSW